MRELRGRERLSNLPSVRDLEDGRAKTGPNSSEVGLIRLSPSWAPSGKLCRFPESLYFCSFCKAQFEWFKILFGFLSSLLVHLSYCKHLKVLGTLGVSILGRLLESALLQLWDQSQPAQSPSEHLTLKALIKPQGDNYLKAPERLQWR